MRHTRQSIKLDVVLGGQLDQRTLCLAPQYTHFNGGGVERLDRGSGRPKQFSHHGVALGVRLWGAALFDLMQPVVQGLHQEIATFGVVQQIVLQIGVALHHPDIAQHLVQHAGRAASTPLAAQLIEQAPGALPQQANHDFPVRK